VGFVGGWVFMTLLSAIVSWIIQRMLNKYYGEPDVKTAQMEAREDTELLNDLDKSH
jgi:large-conductance mechanosensitive channel